MADEAKSRRDVALLTWHYHRNVGSCLQAYAMYSTVRSLGYDGVFLNYRKGWRENPLWRIVRDTVSRLYLILPHVIPARRAAQAHRFQQDFLEQTRLCSRAEELKSFNGQFRMYLVGSDQIWAPNVLDETYLLTFVQDGAKRYAYAPSIGLLSIPDSKKDLYRKYLGYFNRIAVRERQGAELLEKLLGYPIQWVLDPTFLVDAQEWKRLAIWPERKTQRFLFCYFLGKDPNHREWANCLARSNGLQVVLLSEHEESRRLGWILLRGLGPRQFLGWLENSDFVLTDSFHGMNLCMILKKDFYVLERFRQDDAINQNTRIHNLLDAFGLESRLMHEANTILTPVPYTTVAPLICKEQERSLRILKDMLAEGCGH